MTEPTREDYNQYIKLMSNSTINMVMMADKIGDKRSAALMSAFGIILVGGKEEDYEEILHSVKPIIQRVGRRLTNGHRELRDILEGLD